MDEGHRVAEEGLFEELIILHERIFLLCLGFARNPQDAEELTQESYLKAFRRIGSIKDPALAKEWLYRIARNTCLDHGKKKRRVSFVPLSETREPADPDPAQPEEQSLRSERRALLKHAVAKLPRKLREVFVLREYAGLSYEEMAGVLKTKAGTVMSRLNRARKAVAKSVREMEG